MARHIPLLAGNNVSYMCTRTASLPRNSFIKFCLSEGLKPRVREGFGDIPP